MKLFAPSIDDTNLDEIALDALTADTVEAMAYLSRASVGDTVRYLLGEATRERRQSNPLVRQLIELRRGCAIEEVAAS